MKSRLSSFVLALACLVLSNACSHATKSSSSAQSQASDTKKDLNNFTQVNLVANRAEFKPEIVEPQMQNAWGLADRPAGLGGHFWVTAQKTGTSLEYVGDVGSTKIFQDNLKTVDLIDHSKPDSPTGVVFNPAKQFLIDQPSPSGNFRSESKFIFATDTGKLYGWAEKKNEDGTVNRPPTAVLKVDNQKRGDQYFGLGIDSKGEKLFAADFGVKPQLRIFDSQFKEIKLRKDQFQNPFIKGRFSKAGELSPYNVQVLQLKGEDQVFVGFAEIEKNPKTGKLEHGEEQKGPGLGRVVQYNLEGQMIRIWADKGLLNAPWGMAIAPANGFGKFSGCLLVANFGDGSLVAFDPNTFEAIDYLQSNGKKIQIDGLWALMFGNGASLGESSHLYFTAGPNDETDGIFGKLKLETSNK